MKKSFGILKNSCMFVKPNLLTHIKYLVDLFKKYQYGIDSLNTSHSNMISGFGDLEGSIPHFSNLIFCLSVTLKQNR